MTQKFEHSQFAGDVMVTEPTKAIVLETSDHQHIGFTLFHPDFGASKGDCVFIVVSKKDDLYGSKKVSILLDIKERGEHQRVRVGGDVVVSFNGAQILKYSSNGTLVYMSSDIDLGIWFPAPLKQ